MPENNEEQSVQNRFVVETLPAIAAYLKVSMLTMEKDVLPSLATADKFAHNSAEEILVLLRRLYWHFTAAEEATNDIGDAFDKLSSDQSAFAALSSLGDTQETPRAPIDAKLLTSALQSGVKGAESLQVENFKLLAGGRSKLTALFTQTGCSQLPGNLVLRMDWASAVTGTSVVAEYDVLKAVHEAGVKAPAPYALVDAENPLGAAFMVMERLPGSPLGDIFEPPSSDTLALELAEQLGKLHSIPIASLSHLSLLEEREHGAASLQEKFDEFNGIFESLGDQNPIAAKARDMIRERIPTMAGPKTLVHSDLGFHNFLVDNARLSGVLDWELAHFGHPANDLGYIQGDILRMVSWDKFMDKYRTAGGPAVTDNDVNFYFLWSLFRLYCLLLRAREGIKLGMVQDISVVRVCADSTPRLLETLAIGIRRIDGT